MKNHNYILCTALSVVLMATLIGCEKQRQTADAEALLEKKAAIQTEAKPTNRITLPNCLLDVKAKQIKKCKPEINQKGVIGLEGELAITAIRPDRQWAPSVGIEFLSEDESDVLRLVFKIKKFTVDANGNALVSETPFTGSIERWSNKEIQSQTAIEAHILPAKPFSFTINWKHEGIVSITLDSDALEEQEIDFAISKVLFFGSGVRVATADFKAIKQ